MAEQKAQHGCLRRLDEFMFCMSVTNQLGTYYHEGMYNDCRQHFQRWQTCLCSRLKKPEEGAQLLLEEQAQSHTGTHVFLFRPEYAGEARHRPPERCADDNEAVRRCANNLRRAPKVRSFIASPASRQVQY